ncbi:hypothetical protein PZA11_000390 [Diplocarpon coronariae]|uniref:Uncharacterized protein n=1 Tax=Diplocarpon coronariae TaxID=2795749 RepID=A0A218YSM5_9HELO|nr:hypothetical protein JHW43_009207 [Diplocarpon mali]OWO97385.1 hypothetical protein B2J93_3085 [Marssonina coronariae]
MEPFIALGLTGADKLIDNHFHKLPDKALQAKTYDPRNIPFPGRRKHRNTSKDSEPDYRDNWASDSETEDGPRDRNEHRQYHSQSSPRSDLAKDRYYSTPNPYETKGSDIDCNDTQSTSQVPPGYRTTTYVAPSYLPDSPFAMPPVYSHDPPRVRPEYLPSPPPSEDPYYSPPPSPAVNRIAMNRGRDTDPYDDEDYHSDSYQRPRRPRPNTRRSSSYHRAGDHYGHGQIVARSHGSGSEMINKYSDRARNTAHRYKLKEEMNDLFTGSTAGLTGGAVGAVVGGWAAQKAQIGYTKNRYKHDPNPFLTLIGATVGGLAVNAAVDKWQDGKKAEEKKERIVEEKYRSEDESGDGEGDDGRSHKSHRSRRRGHHNRKHSYD